MKRLPITTISAVLLATTAFADPIHEAAANGDLDGIQVELDNGVDVNARDEDGMTPLQCVVIKGHKEVAELLIARGTNVKVKDNDGETPRDRAILRNDGKIADILRKHGGKTGEALKAKGKCQIH